MIVECRYCMFQFEVPEQDYFEHMGEQLKIVCPKCGAAHGG